MTDTVSSAYTRYNEALGEVPNRLQSEVDRLCSQAVSYVWGFQDAGGEVKDTGRSTEFGYAYGTVAARYAAERLGAMRPPIQDAWRSWQEHGDIRDYNGRPLDR